LSPVAFSLLVSCFPFSLSIDRLATTHTHTHNTHTTHNTTTPLIHCDIQMHESDLQRASTHIHRVLHTRCLVRFRFVLLLLLVVCCCCVVVVFVVVVCVECV
jgi:uncharacterized BrkB/YihY/UPF0761 family membrane protein